jgi:hypothetical protein
VYLPVRADVAPLLIGAAAEFHLKVEKLHPGWCWGWAPRAVRGGTAPSFHSAAIAEDLNAPLHPLGTSPARSFSSREIALCRAIARKYGLRWGGDYRGRKDPMHFEVVLSPAQARALIRKLKAKPTPKPKPKPLPVVDLSRLLAAARTDPRRPQGQGSYEVGTLVVERALTRAGLLDARYASDGYYGTTTVAAYAAWQRRLNYKPSNRNGLPGPKSLAALGSRYGFRTVA